MHVDDVDILHSKVCRSVSLLLLEKKVVALERQPFFAVVEYTTGCRLAPRSWVNVSTCHRSCLLALLNLLSSCPLCDPVAELIVELAAHGSDSSVAIMLPTLPHVFHTFIAALDDRTESIDDTLGLDVTHGLEIGLRVEVDIRSLALATIFWWVFGLEKGSNSVEIDENPSVSPVFLVVDVFDTRDTLPMLVVDPVLLPFNIEHWMLLQIDQPTDIGICRVVDSPLSPLNFFKEAVQVNLLIVLCMVGTDVSRKCEGDETGVLPLPLIIPGLQLCSNVLAFTYSCVLATAGSDGNGYAVGKVLVSCPRALLDKGSPLLHDDVMEPYSFLIVKSL
jgi:hypothetical protein